MDKSLADGKVRRGDVTINKYQDIPQKLASIILLSYNSRNDLEECIPSLTNQTYLNFEIIVVDNASTDSTPDFIRTEYPDIKLVETGSNLGYPAGNNIGFEHAKGDYIVILNPDTVVDPNWLLQLIKPLSENPDIAITTPKILLYGRPDKINTCGNSVHFTGLDFCRGLNEPSTSFSTIEEVGAISGCSFAIRRGVFKELGGFDPDFFLYLEDVDLSLRARIAGYRIMFVPESIVYHKFELSITPWKLFYLERNRYILQLGNYSLKMLILLSPVFFVSEIVTWGHSVLHGFSFMKNKFRAYWWILTNPGKIMKKRQEVQRYRRINDKEFIKYLDWRIPFEQAIRKGIMCYAAGKIFNSLFRIYYILLDAGLNHSFRLINFINVKIENINGLL